MEAGDLTHPTSGLMKPGEGLAQVLSKDEKLLGTGKLPMAGSPPKAGQPPSGGQACLRRLISLRLDSLRKILYPRSDVLQMIASLCHIKKIVILRGYVWDDFLTLRLWQNCDIPIQN